MSDRGFGALATAFSEPAATVLVVDDYGNGRYTKSRVLEHAGFRVIEASTGKEALRIVTEQHPELVVLDVNLPDVDGNAVCRAIKSDPASADTMVLQVSAYYTSAEDQAQGFESGADGYIPGDTAPGLLVAAARALLRTRRAEERVRDREQRLRLAQALARSQQDLRALAGTLFNAQEQERRRIARELHDDFSQRMAVLEMELSNLRSRAPSLHEDFDRVIGYVASLSRELRDLSHILHPSVLEDLGLESALRGLCEEFERSHNIGTYCTCSIGNRPIPLHTATVFYRIAQEALRNVAKHAGDARVTITLAGQADKLSLTIEDDGCGFDPDADRAEPALGIVSMQERARLVGGCLELHSAPGQGTKVKVSAPWPAAVASEVASKSHLA